jgi:hypothetical protein
MGWPKTITAGQVGGLEFRKNKQTNKQKTKELPCSLMYANKK